MREYEKLWLHYLESKGWKPTLPRRRILEAVFSLHEHFDAEQLHARLHKAHQGISLATVYRTLPLLVEAGLIQLSLRFSSRDVYEHIYGHPRHIHWLCQICGQVQETDLDNIGAALQKEARKLKFQADETNIQVRGVCWKCQSSDNESQ